MARFFSRNRSILKYLGKLNRQKSFTDRLTTSTTLQQSFTREEYEANKEYNLLTKDDDQKTISDSATVRSIAATLTGSGVTSKDAIINLASSGLTAGDASIVFIDSNSAKYYISNGSGWYNVALVNADPQWDSAPNSSYTLDSTNPLAIEPIAIDSGGKIFSYTATLDSDASQFMTITKDSDNGRIFTLTGDSEGAVSASNSGVVTFKASDGIGIVTQNSTINLQYATPDITGITLLLVGGGGGGGGSPHGGGGGSGGGLLVSNVTLSGDTKKTINVGSGGTGYTGRTSSPWPSAGTNKGGNGGNSSAFGYTAIGGGAGGGYSGGGASDTPGQDGGSGGGGTDESAAGSSTQSALDPNTETAYGNAGGTSTSNTYSKGGGGMGSAGGAQSQGGAGFDFSATFGTGVGVNGVFGGGGGGSVYNGTSTTSYRAGGSGGGGNGGQNNSAPYAPTDGTANTGGGGGGAERVSPGKGGDGGSGVVLVKMLTSATSGISTTGSPTTHTFGSYTIYEFTQNGSITNGTAAQTTTLEDLNSAGDLLHYLDANESECTDGTSSGTINDLGSYSGTWSRGSGAADVTVQGVKAFDNRSQYFEVATGQTLASPMAQIYLIRPVSTRSSWGTLFRNGDDHLMLLKNTSDEIGIYDNTPTQFNGFGTNSVDDTWQTVIINSASTSSSTLYFNGQSSGSVSWGAGDTSLSRTTYRLGWPSQGIGYVAVAAMVDRQLTSDEISNLHSELIGRVT